MRYAENVIVKEERKEREKTMSNENQSGPIVNDLVIKRIRDRFGVTQTGLAEHLGVTFATVNRWENGKNQPPPAMREKLEEYCKKQGASLEEFTGNKVESGKGSLQLYCLGEQGLSGPLSADALGNCPLGFSLCSSETHLANHLRVERRGEGLCLYGATLDTSALRLFTFGNLLDFVLYESFAEGRLSKTKYNALYQRYAAMADRCDLVVGVEKNDMARAVIKRFLLEQLTDVALIKAMEKLGLPRRYIAVSDRARLAVTVKQEIKISVGAENAYHDTLSQEEARVAELDEILKSNRRVGLYLDELEEKARQSEQPTPF